MRSPGAALTQAAAACVLIASALALPAAARPTAPPTAHPTATATPTAASDMVPPATVSASPSPQASAGPAGAGRADASAGGTTDGLADGVAAGLANRALDSLFETIGEAAVWSFGRVISWVDTTSSPDVTQPWFADVYGRTYWLSATIALIALVWALTAGALRGGVTGMLGTVPRLLLVVVGLAVAVPIVQTLLEFTDWLTERFGGEVGENMRRMTNTLGAILGGGAGDVTAQGSSIPGFILALVALVIVVASLLVWLQLIFRTAVIYLLLAAAAFPAAMSINRTSTRPIRKVIAWIVAMAFAKPVIVLALWIGSAPFAAGSRADIAAVLTGAGIMVTAVLAPWALFRLFDFAGSHVVSAASSREHPARMRTHVEQPEATYRRTSMAVADRAKAAREHGVPGFSPTRPRAATAGRAAVRPARIGATAVVGGIAAIGAAAGRLTSGTEPDTSAPPPPSRTGGAPPPAPAPVAARAGGERPDAPDGDDHRPDNPEHPQPPARPPRRARPAPGAPPVQRRPVVDPRGADDDR